MLQSIFFVSIYHFLEPFTNTQMYLLGLILPCKVFFISLACVSVQYIKLTHLYA